ncbi:MAG: hypothetical protein E6J41_03915 [Chloroflexi bacterium]|nr:MAG: hypothetical protein E6J41_03915 [Chloroflexota bacterium]
MSAPPLTNSWTGSSVEPQLASGLEKPTAIPSGTPLVRLRPWRSASLSEKPASSTRRWSFSPPLVSATYRPTFVWAGPSANLATPWGAALVRLLPSGSVRWTWCASVWNVSTRAVPAVTKVSGLQSVNLPGRDHCTRWFSMSYGLRVMSAIEANVASG